MEILFEIIFELIFEGSIELGSSCRVPMPVRIIALVIFLAISLGIAGILVLVTVSFAKFGEYLIAVLCGILAAAFIFFIVKKLIACIKARS